MKLAAIVFLLGVLAGAGVQAQVTPAEVRLVCRRL
jgi:hypothetical protein